MKKSQSNAQMQMDNNVAKMSCHENAAKNDKKIQHDKSCIDCKNCLSANVVIYTQLGHLVTFASIIPNATLNNFVSAIAESIYSPPKQIS